VTRYAMAVDLNRCVGCQTCTASCKHANATPPGVQWRRVLDMEFGTYPDVARVFVPTGCQHCDEPPCMDVCPTQATKKRADGIVTIDYDACIGCGYCMVACPYDARTKVAKPAFAYGAPTKNEAARFDEGRIGVATKCTFCVERIDAGIAAGQKPGVDPDATPACVNACIASALTFGDIDDPRSNVSRLVAENAHFRMHEELGTGPRMYYLYDRERYAAEDVAAAEQAQRLAQ
jgi:phenylacetyl-CoA:acceptor oxidoreductase 27-kDa subunit